MKRAINPPTKAEQAYQDALRALGCAVCAYRIANGLQRAAQPFGHHATQIHHRNSGDQHGQPQIGQHAVVALCPWHHDGDQLPGMTRDAMREAYGPSFKHHARDFRIWTEDALPKLPGRGTERWQAYQDQQLQRKGEA